MERSEEHGARKKTKSSRPIFFPFPLFTRRRKRNTKKKAHPHEHICADRSSSSTFSIKGSALFLSGVPQ